MPPTDIIKSEIRILTDILEEHKYLEQSSLYFNLSSINGYQSVNMLLVNMNSKHILWIYLIYI